jgi:hypothetical protein
MIRCLNLAPAILVRLNLAAAQRLPAILAANQAPPRARPLLPQLDMQVGRLRTAHPTSARPATSLWAKHGSPRTPANALWATRQPAHARMPYRLIWIPAARHKQERQPVLILSFTITIPYHNMNTGYHKKKTTPFRIKNSEKTKKFTLISYHHKN